MAVALLNKRKELDRGIRAATQRVPSEEGIDGPGNDNYFRKWRRDLIEFLERAVKFGEPIWCCLRRADPHHS